MVGGDGQRRLRLSDHCKHFGIYSGHFGIYSKRDGTSSEGLEQKTDMLLLQQDLDG